MANGRRTSYSHLLVTMALSLAWF